MKGWKGRKKMERTTELMLSEDWKERLVAEYLQLEERLRLLNLNKKQGKKDGEDITELKEQAKAMRQYSHCLKRSIARHRIDIKQYE